MTDRPIVAVLYTHFHYVSGTTAVFEERGSDVPVYGHARIAINKAWLMSCVNGRSYTGRSRKAARPTQSVRVERSSVTPCRA